MFVYLSLQNFCGRACVLDNYIAVTLEPYKYLGLSIDFTVPLLYQRALGQDS